MWPIVSKGGYVGTTDHLYKRRPGGGHYDNFDDYYDKYDSDDWYDVDDYEDYYDRGFDKRRLDLGSESDYDYLDDTGRTDYYRRLNRKRIGWN